MKALELARDTGAIMDIRIRKMTETPTFTTDGKAAMMIDVVFMVGEYGPFTEHFHREGLTAASIMDKLRAFQRELAQLPFQSS